MHYQTKLVKVEAKQWHGGDSLWYMEKFYDFVKERCPFAVNGTYNRGDWFVWTPADKSWAILSNESFKDEYKEYSSVETANETELLEVLKASNGVVKNLVNILVSEGVPISMDLNEEIHQGIDRADLTINWATIRTNSKTKG